MTETWQEWAERALPEMHRDFLEVSAKVGIAPDTLLSLAIYAGLNTTMAAVRGRPELIAKMERLADISLKDLDEDKPWEKP